MNLGAPPAGMKRVAGAMQGPVWLDISGSALGWNNQYRNAGFFEYFSTGAADQHVVQEAVAM